ncbi:phage protein [Secundilactobacillus oryzae JCM 18671]|uniref:Phage protein n=1 Tax=Secundilactobacillus oryzae JCM 18671 TaxID=1291743 RepID=A0A081BI80_9LACO|nr:DUF1351 domain-containing protein [Secundilactobacillus oryzae]GAK47748.1 phage protein [Secundilactobacillus oryzae JCM 18671]
MSETVELVELPKFGIQYSPTEIVINGKEELEEAIKAYAQKYKDIAVSNETESESKKILAELRKVNNELDSKRKSVKRAYSEPLKDFEAEVKDLQSNLTAVISPINDGLKELEEQHRLDRERGVELLISGMAKELDIDPNRVRIAPNWLNKSITQSKLKDEITATLTELKNADDLLKANKKQVTDYAKQKQVEPDGWIAQLEQGQELEYIFKAIDNVAAKHSVEAIKKTVAHESIPETPEIPQATANTESTKVEASQRSAVQSYTLKITGTIDQLFALKNYMVNNGLKFEKA